jgi:hypothetical protein
MNKMSICTVSDCGRPLCARGFCNSHYARFRRNGIPGVIRDPSPIVRFWARVNKTEGCWLWTGPVDGAGYGRMGARSRAAHRVAYEWLIGPVPDGLELDHLCRVRNCVNVSHLEPVTHRENVLRGDSMPARKAKQTHCIHGHLLSEDNIYREVTRPNGRKCRECALLASHKAFLKRRTISP